MFWKKKAESSPPKASKLPGPREMPDIVGGHLVTDFNNNPDWVWKLKAVLRRRPESRHAFDVRIFDEVETATRKVKIRDYTTLDEYPELILYEGWFDTELRQVKLEEKRTS